MTGEREIEGAVTTLQNLGLQEYEARCFVGLSRMESATAKQLSEATDVPRTRVYDAVRELDERGLVEISHDSPQRYRAVPLGEATGTLRSQYESRIERLEATLSGMERIEPEGERQVQEVWTLSGTDAIDERTASLVRSAEEEVVLVVCDDRVLTEGLVESLNAADEGVDLLIGAPSEPLRTRVGEAVPGATTFLSGLEWLRSDDPNEGTEVGRLLLVDRSSLLASSVVPPSGEERATFGTGFGNGLVVVGRRLLSEGLLAGDDRDGD